MQGSAHQTATRRQAQARKVLKALYKHATSVKPEDMKATHQRAAEIFLRKTIPDLRSTELTGEVSLKQFFVEHGETEAKTSSE